MHVGHCRGAVVGDALANLLAFAGFDVTREYYVNDAGAQVDALARSAYLRYREALGEDIGEIPEGLYPGDYLKPVGAGAGRASTATSCSRCRRANGCRSCATRHRGDAGDDPGRSRRARHPPRRVLLRALADRRPRDEVAETIADLQAPRASSMKAACRRPRASVDEDWEDREQTLFRSTEFGDDIDRPLVKSDGSYTYFAADIAYHRDKFDRGFADHDRRLGRRPRRPRQAHAGGGRRRSPTARPRSTSSFVQLVRLFRGGEPVKMSKRCRDVRHARARSWTKSARTPSAS